MAFSVTPLVVEILCLQRAVARNAQGEAAAPAVPAEPGAQGQNQPQVAEQAQPQPEVPLAAGQVERPVSWFFLKTSFCFCSIYYPIFILIGIPCFISWTTLLNILLSVVLSICAFHFVHAVGHALIFVVFCGLFYSKFTSF